MICVFKLDEIHHAIRGEHAFKRLIETFYNHSKQEYRPRIIGLTASPSSGLTDPIIINDLTILSNLIDGRIYMPVIYEDDLNLIVNRPNLKFIETFINPKHATFVNIVNELIQPFISYLNPCANSFKLELNKISALKSLIRNEKNEANNQVNQKRFTIASFLDLIVNSLEIMSIIGLDSAVDFLQISLEKEIKNNKKHKEWSKRDIESMEQLESDIRIFKGEISKKIKALASLLEQNLDGDNRSIVFVRSRKTARFIVDFLNRIQIIKKNFNPKIFVGHVIEIELMFLISNH